jgi:hypothetical protein
LTAYRLTFTPAEPYFFGNEKTFRFPDAKIAGQFDNPYFIRSESIPSQTTLFGAVRYLLLNDRDPSFASYPENYEKRIGPNSFSLIQTEKQKFGIIHAMSPVFLQNADGIYVKTPFDHLAGEKIYTPFHRAPLTADGVVPKREYADNYDVKKGISDSFMNIGTGAVVDADVIFRTVTRVGIDKKKNDDAFFKKEFRMLNPGWSFGVYLTLDLAPEDAPELDPVVFLGQNKAAFRVTCTPEDDRIAEQVYAILPPNTVYCLGDTCADSDIYPKFTFAATQIRDHRMYETKPDGRIGKGSILHRLLRAGSVFWFDPASLNEADIAALFNHPNARTIGMNSIIIKK